MRELFHRYFHEPEKRGRYERVNYSFDGDFFYSYYTAIGIKLTGRGKNPVLLIADNSMTPTTGRHIRYLESACPYGAERIIEVPLVYGLHQPTIEDITARFSSFFLKYDGAGLSRAENRRKVQARAAAARQFSTLVRKLPKKVMAAVETLDHAAAAIEEKKSAARVEKQRAAAEKYREKCAAILATIPDMPYMGKVRSIFEEGSALTTDQKRALLTTIAVTGDSFVWPCGDQVRTSQGVTLPAALITDLIKRWIAGTLPVGSHVGPYTLRAYDGQHVRIGCHNIPLENIRALAAELLPAD